MDITVESALRFWSEFTSWSPPMMTMYTMLGLSILSAWLMTRFVAAAPLFAGPISFIVLTFAALLSNFALRGIGMMGTSDMQRVIVFTVLGHAVAGILLLAAFKVSGKGRAR